MVFLTSYDKPCFKDKIEAWPYGPVVPCVYNVCKLFGARQYIPYIRDANSEQIIVKDKKIIEEVLAKLEKIVYKHPWQLVDKTHQKGGCWDKTDNYETIPLDDIKNDKTINFDEINVKEIINEINFD